MKSSTQTSAKSQLGSEAKSPVTSGEIVIGVICKVDHTGVHVDFPQNPEDKDLLALSTLAIEEKHIGREVALLFNGGDLRHPVIMGVIHSAMLDSFSSPDTSKTEASETKPQEEIEVLADGKKCHIKANEELKLQCGKASITMTKDGKIFLRGTYLSSRSSGTNRMLGGSVLLN